MSLVKSILQDVGTQYFQVGIVFLVLDSASLPSPSSSDGAKLPLGWDMWVPPSN